MQSLRFATVVGLWLGSVSAQFAMHAVTVTPVGILAQNANMRVGVPAGAAADALDFGIGGPIDWLYLRTATPALPNGAGFNLLTGIGTQLAANTCGTTAATSGFTPGAIELRVTLSGPPGTVGTLQLNTVAAGPVPYVRAFAVDVQADGSVELGVAGAAQVPVVIGASGQLPVRVVLEHSLTQAAPNGSSLAHVIVNFQAAPFTACSITPYGSGCGGAQSTGTALTLGAARSLTLLGAGSYPQNPVLSLFGTVNVGPVLPGGCGLLTDGALPFLTVADAAGYAVHTVTLSAQAVGTLYHQFVPLDLAAFAFRASNGLDITCTP